jgi:hypothetical protein
MSSIGNDCKIIESQPTGMYSSRCKIAAGTQVFTVNVYAEPHETATVIIDEDVPEDSNLRDALETLALADYWGVADQLLGHAPHAQISGRKR